jgi:hypothetical protein
MDQIPTFNRVGDIIRIHRANISLYLNQKSFCVNMSYGSSWVVFDGLLGDRVDDHDDKAKSETAIFKYFGMGEQKSESDNKNNDE